MLRLSPPIKDFSFNKSISQLFGMNPALYAQFNIPGHNGLDIFFPGADTYGYGTPILAAHDGKIVRIEYDVPHRTKGNGIELISNDGSFTTIYWHLSAFQCNVGDIVKEGDVIGLAGNSGFVRPIPTLTEPHNGTHLHFGYKPQFKNNEYGGYSDPTPVLFKEGDRLPQKLVLNLMLGSKSDQVSLLQTFLKLEGFAYDYDPIGYFGTKTLRDVRLMQEKRFISPALGFVWNKTREFLNGRYSAY